MDTPSVTIQKRNAALYFVLSIVTCGIFGLYWFYTLNNDTNKISGHPEAMGGVVALLLTIVTCGIFTLFWAYNMGTRIDEAKVKRGLPSGNLGTIYLILTIFGLVWVAELLLQGELNRLAD